MKKLEGIAKRITAMLLSSMLVIGLVSGSIFASEIEVDTGQTSEIAVDDDSSEEAETEASMEDVSEDIVEYYTIVLDANGGYFVNEWDDVLGETVQNVDVLNKNIPLGEAVAIFPLREQENAVVTFLGWSLDRDGEIMSQGYEEYVPIENCVLYAIWKIEEYSDSSTEGSVSPVENNSFEDSDNQNPQNTDTADDSMPISTDASDNNVDSGGNSKEENITVTATEEIVSTDSAMGKVASGTCGKNLTWILDEKGTLTISGTGGMYDYFPDGTVPWYSHRSTIKKIIIENGVTRIGDDVFGYFINLTSITLPDSVTGIGMWAFENCSSLTSIKLPDTLTTIEDFAFFKCTSLRSITIPDGVTSIAESAFHYCTSLNSVILPDGIKYIGESAFAGCTSLVNITLPKRLTNICSCVFENCECLTNVYFSGNLPLIGYNIFENVVATAYYPKDNSTWTDDVKQNYGGTITWVPWDSCSEGFLPVKSVPIKNGVFQFRSLLKNDDTIEYLFDYDDAWVFSNKSSDRYNLLKTAIRVSMAAFGTKGSDNDYGPENIQKMMDTMGYKHTETSINYEKPRYDSIGSAIGLKNILNADGSESSIILVALRGGGYGIEWGGDFRVGSPDHLDHEGFRKAAEAVEERLKIFVDQNKSYISSDVKVWITGFSRAAATTNLVAADLINNTYSIDGISPEDVIAFCFECPQNRLFADTNSIGKKNIINIVNPIDFVPKVAFKMWGFSRYGTTYYIPSKETTFLYNLKYKYDMKQKYKELCNYNDGIELTDDQVTENIGQASLLDKYFDFLSAAINRKEYYEKHENSFMDITAGFLGHGSTPDWGAAVPSLLKFLGVSVLQPYTSHEVMEMFIKGNSGPGPVAHYPELCMSWIDSLNSFSDYKTNENSWYRTVLVNCPVNVTVKDYSGKIVGQIVENEVKAVEDGIVVRLDGDDQKTFVLPQDAEYTIDIQGTDAGKLNYTIKEYNFDTSSTEKVTIYKDLDITQGEEIIGTISTGNSVGDADYTLKYKDEEELLKPDEELTRDDIKSFTVEAISSGNGEVIGGGFYINGEFAKLSAKADEGYEFVGWYRSNKCISTETEYRFPVTENVIINAVFVPEQVEIIDKGSCGESATWKFDKNGQLTISGKGAVEDYFMDNIPHAPWLGKNVKKVVVGEGITRIGNYSFYYMRSITEVVLPKSLKEIGWGAFQECSSLSKVNIPTGVEFIDGIAFDSTAWLAEKRKQNAYVVINGILIDGRSVKGDEINIPRDVKIIAPGSFSDKNFKHVIIPEGVELISSFAFNNDWTNDGLQSLVIPVSIKKIDEWAFRGRSVKEVKYGGPPSKWKQFNISKDYNKELWYADISFTYNAISEATVSGINNKTYTGKPIVQNVKVKAGSESLKEKIDYYVSYSNNTDVGTATISIVGCGDYTGTRIETFEINPAAQIFDVKTTATSLEVGKKATVSTTGAKGKLSYKSSNTAIAAVNASSGIVTAKRVGTVTITASSAATANYKQASKTINITIVPATQIINVKTTATSLAVGKKATVSTTGAKGKITYKSSNTAVATVDATTGVVTAKKIGMATITASSAATADYKQASKTVKITIVPAATSSLTASNLTTGIKLKWKKVVGAKGYYVYRGTKLIKTINAASSVSYTDKKANANGVKYTYKIVAKASTGKGAAKTLVIYRISQPSISSVKNSGSRKMAVKWSKNAKASGYQMQYSPQKLFKTGNKTVTLTSAGTVSKTVGSLTKGKTYYVRIRTYKTIGGKKYYSTWSATKALKISK